MGLFDKIFGKASSGEVKQRTTHNNPYIIKSPTIGFLNLMGEIARPLIEKDRAALVGLFAGEREPLMCDVLFVYAGLSKNGD